MSGKHPRSLLVACLLLCFSMACLNRAQADELYGKIRGVVTDPSGAVVSGARVTATNINTGISKHVTTLSDGSYELAQLSVPADYDVKITKRGFKTYAVRRIHLDLDQVFVQNATLALGTLEQTVVVEANPVQVDTTTMQLGTTIGGTQIVDLPLNGRNWIQLQQIQPGVVAASDARGDYATNGSQSQQNAYLINGDDTNDLPLNTPLVIPSPDAIGEFHMVTNTLNPEYGRNSGAILNAVIKSGTNRFHGDGFEFYRDTSLNARNFFSPSAQVFHQNQFGGTLGGPIWKDHTFFFFSYQGTRNRVPQAGGNTTVFTPAQRQGNFPDIATASGVSPLAMVGSDGQTYPAGTAYSTLFPTGQILQADFNPIALNLLNKYVPPPNVGNTYQFDPITTGLDDQYITRIDHTLSTKDALWGYWLWERRPTTDTLPFTGASLPGFADTSQRHTQQYTLAWNHTFNSSMLNEARFGYTRLNFVAVQPLTPALPSSFGFTGINPQYPQGAGAPLINLTGYFTLGFSNNGPQPRIDQTYQGIDNFTKIVGRHTFKLGFDMERFQVYNPFFNNNNGNFAFTGVGPFSTGDPGADFLLGLPTSYDQSSGDIINARAQEYYSYVQDEFKIKPNLTLTYGVGWAIDTPLNDLYHSGHAVGAFRPGEQSQLFPNAPAGYVFQGDPGINATGTTHYNNFGPRLGVAYSPDWGWLTGGAGKTSLRAGFGIYYNRFEEETMLQSLALPPWALTATGVGAVGGAPSFASPYAGWALSNGVVSPVSVPNLFPFGGPSPNVQFGQFEPMLLSTFDPNINDPYSENYNFTIERQLSRNMILSLGYVGSNGHREMLAHELNPGINPAGCAANPVCGGNPFAQGANFPNNYRYAANIFQSIGSIASIGNSNYNAFQASLNKHFSRGLRFLASYTWSHALDNGSSFENSSFGGGGFGGFGSLRGTNPFNQHLGYGPSIYDATQRFVFSYAYDIPSARHFQSLQWLPSRLTDGWKITGITTFQSGFPLDVIDTAMQSLTCPSPFGFYACWDVPNSVSTPQYYDPRTSSLVNKVTPSASGTAAPNYWFNPNTFAVEPLGSIGNAGRNLLRGPGLNNFDFSLMKDTKITENKTLELRFEFYNLFNHTQFDPNGIVTDINAGNFGQEFAAYAPRLIQLAAKFYF